MTATTHSSQGDRNFDDIAEHFAHKVYGGLKGEIRLAVLGQDLAALKHAPPKSVLDIGAGLGQISLDFAKHGHDCTLSDISSVMLAKAQHNATLQGLSPRFVHAPYQNLPTKLDQQFDVILCHALLEWIQEPTLLFEVIDQLLKPQGVLSLCFYNPASFVYRNLIMGNFNHLNHPKPANSGSLTPNFPKSYETVMHHLQDYHLIKESGIRVFYDYTTHQRGGLANPQAIIQMECRYASQLPYRLMGRYLHILAQKS